MSFFRKKVVPIVCSFLASCPLLSQSRFVGATDDQPVELIPVEEEGDDQPPANDTSFWYKFRHAGMDKLAWERQRFYSRPVGLRDVWNSGPNVHDAINRDIRRERRRWVTGRALQLVGKIRRNPIKLGTTAVGTAGLVALLHYLSNEKSKEDVEEPEQTENLDNFEGEENDFVF